MSESLILTHHPHVQNRLKAEYKDAAESILSFPEFAGRLLNSKSVLTRKDRVSRMRSCRERLLQGDSFSSELDGLLVQLLSRLKQSGVSLSSFKSVAHRYPYSEARKTFYKKVATLFEAYEDKGEVRDEDDLYREVIQESRLPHLHRVLVLAHDVYPLEKDFLTKTETLISGTSGMERLSLGGDLSRKSPVHVFEALSEISEIRWLAKQVRDRVKAGIPYRNIFIFCADLSQYVSLIRMVFRKDKIPFHTWEKRGNLESVSLFPLTANAMVSADMKEVFLVGLSREPFILGASLLTDDDKVYFNTQLKKALFFSQSEERERLKQVLQWVAHRSPGFTMIYAVKPAPVFREFLSEAQAKRLTKEIVKKRETQKAPILKRVSDSVMKRGLKQVLPRVYSVRSLTQYQKCPYGFLLKECFKFYPETPVSEELSALQEGDLIHDMLWRYYSNQRDLGAVLEESCSVVEERFGISLSGAERERVHDLLLNFLSRDAEWQRKEHYQPRFFEWSFESDFASVPIVLKGKVDRIDVDPNEGTFRIIDYKTGTSVPSSKEVQSGRNLQLSLYAMAVENLLLKDYWPKESYFYMVKSAERKKGFVFKSRDEWEELRDRVRQEIRGVMGSIHQLSFPGTPDQCYSKCECAHLCSAENV